MRRKILSLVEKRGNLPAFPEILIKLQDLMKNPDAGIVDVVGLIELDPALSGTILKISNSPFYKTGYQEIDSLQTAVNRLGLERIKQIVFSLKVTKLFSDTVLLNPKQLWAHSLAVAHFSQMLADFTGISAAVRNNAYFSGLMHDVGILVFCYIIPDDYASFLSSLEPRREIPFEKLEMEVFGIDHQELGARFILKWWQVDTEIVKAVRYHHFPFSGSNNQRKCQQLVHVANGVCTAFGQSNGIECFNEVFNPGAWEALGLSLDQVEELMADVDLSVSGAASLLS